MKYESMKSTRITTRSTVLSRISDLALTHPDDLDVEHAKYSSIIY